MPMSSAQLVQIAVWTVLCPRKIKSRKRERRALHAARQTVYSE